MHLYRNNINLKIDIPYSLPLPYIIHRINDFKKIIRRQACKYLSNIPLKTSRGGFLPQWIERVPSFFVHEFRGVYTYIRADSSWLTAR